MAADSGMHARAGQPPARDPFVRRVASVLAMAAATAVLVVLLWLSFEVLLVAFAGVLLAVFLRALSDPLAEHTPLSPGWALAVVLLVGLLLLGAGGWLLAPQLAEQAAEVQEQLPGAVAQLQDFLRERAWGRWLLDQAGDDQATGALAPAAGTLLADSARWIGYLLTFLFVGLFAAANPRLYVDGTVRLVPIRHRGRAREVIDRLGYTLRWWLIGRALAMLLVGVSTTVLLLVLGAPFAPLLGLVAGLFTFVPYLGPIAAAVPIGLVTLLEDASLALYAVGAYTAVQLFEGYVLDPLIQQRMVYLPPALTLVSQILLGMLIGTLGIALATPLAAVAMVLVTMVYVEDVLGDGGS